MDPFLTAWTTIQPGYCLSLSILFIQLIDFSSVTTAALHCSQRLRQLALHHEWYKLRGLVTLTSHCSQRRSYRHRSKDLPCSPNMGSKWHGSVTLTSHDIQWHLRWPVNTIGGIYYVLLIWVETYKAQSSHKSLQPVASAMAGHHYWRDLLCSPSMCGSSRFPAG